MTHWVKSLRKQLHLTQSQLAQRLGVTRVTIGRWENGQACPGKSALEAIYRLAESASTPKTGGNLAYQIPKRGRRPTSSLPSTTLPTGQSPGVEAVKFGKPDDSIAPSFSEPRRTTDILKQCPLFSDLDRKQLTELSRIASRIQLRPGQFLFFQGGPVEFCYVVASGRIKILKHSPLGKDRIIGFYRPGETAGIIVLVRGKPHAGTGQALVETTVLAIRSHDFLSFLYRDPELNSKILRRMLDVVSKRHEAVSARLGDLLLQRPDGRLARVLSELCSYFGTTVPLTRSEIAQMAGTTTETAIRFTSRLRKTGVVQSFRGKVIVLEPEKLRRLAELPM
ncbi:MAG: helix-turn-helix domain-containing protein [Chloroflexi bacterium]|nr:helix-turn-helix domain-containing protein [Chloroflexota bacterium]